MSREQNIRLVDIVYRCKYNVFTTVEIMHGVENEYRANYAVFKDFLPEKIKYIEDNLENIITNSPP